MSYAGDRRKLIKIAKKAGVEVENGRSHVKLVWEGRVVAVLDNSMHADRDWRWTLRTLRKAGVPV